MTTPVKGAKFPLYLTLYLKDEEWVQLLEILRTLPNEKWQQIMSVYVTLKEQLEKMGINV